MNKVIVHDAIERAARRALCVFFIRQASDRARAPGRNRFDTAHQDSPARQKSGILESHANSSAQEKPDGW
ncbi:MAG: hypothetical protein H5U19_00650 [Rhodobacteraceae bacterium]|nr:hypothetical protein [Paracoccaceae bacterium]